jgi:putative membrane protein
MHWGPGMGEGAMICGGAIGLLLLIALVVLVIWLITRTSSQGRTPTGGGTTPPKTALEILKERYARGEITREEYLEMREHLREE